MKISNLFTPARVLVLGFGFLILMGALFLTLPGATRDGQGLSFLNALFTATSAVCVTGLVVVDTGTTFTMFGQLVILVLIQVGGLGFMTFATLIAIMLGKRVTFRERLVLQEALNQVSPAGVVRLARYVLLFTFVIESIGALILSFRWSFDLGWEQALYYGIFHAVSAFNNAGFDLFGNFMSLTGYSGDLAVNITIMLLIITGGLGFTVLADLYSHKRKHKKFSLHTKIVLVTTATLIGLGAVFILAIEFSNPKTLGALPLPVKILAASFQSVTTRTAGFNTLNLSDLRDTTLIFMIALMFIGASPGSTGGGVKTTTFISVVLSVLSTFKGEEQIAVKGRTLPREMVKKAVAIITMATLLIFVVVSLLTLTEKADFLTVLFEVTSAFGTVGLSLGLTPHLTVLGKIAIMLTMFTGRVGPLTLGFALSQKIRGAQATIKYPEEKIIIG